MQNSMGFAGSRCIYRHQDITRTNTKNDAFVSRVELAPWKTTATIFFCSIYREESGDEKGYQYALFYVFRTLSDPGGGGK
jgi:hypothetical protein